MDAPWFGWVIGCLATWRLTQLLVRDDGPWDISFKLRRAAGQGAFGRALDCFACCSLWCAAPLAWWVGRDAAESVLVWLALSGAACLLDRLGQAPLMMHALTEPGGTDELLWPESKRVAEPAEPADPAEPAQLADPKRPAWLADPADRAGAGPGGARHTVTEPVGAARPDGERATDGTAIPGNR